MKCSTVFVHSRTTTYIVQKEITRRVVFVDIGIYINTILGIRYEIASGSLAADHPSDERDNQTVCRKKFFPVQVGFIHSFIGYSLCIIFSCRVIGMHSANWPNWTTFQINK